MYFYPTDYSAVLKHHILEKHLMGEKISQMHVKEELTKQHHSSSLLKLLKCQLAV